MGFLKQKPRGFLETNAWARQFQNSLQYNTSIAGSVVPLIFGTTRQNVNLIGFGNYMGPTGKKGKTVGPLPIQGTSHTGKGSGGKSKKAPPDFTIDVAFGICEGSYDGGTVKILTTSPVWASAQRADFGHLTLNGYNGTIAQAPDHVMAGIGQNVGYSGTCYVTGTPLDLGTSPVLPNLSVAIQGIAAIGPDPTSPGTFSTDARPDDIVNIFLTDSQVGAGFPSANIDTASIADYGSYCAASGLLMSPALTTQSEAQEWLSGLLKLTNSALVWAGSFLRIIPLADLAVAGHGASWFPKLTPLYDLTDADFLFWEPPSPGEIKDGTDDPVILNRTNPADAINWHTIEYLDFTNQFSPTIVVVFDQNAVDTYGRRSGDNIPGHAFTSSVAAQISAQNLLQRELYVRNMYKFKLGWAYSLLEPMDIVTIENAQTGITTQLVRILTIDEDDNGDLTIEAEEIPTQINSAGAACLTSVDWADTFSFTIAGSQQSRIPISTDNAGSWYGPPVLKSSDGSTIFDFTNTNLADAIDAWYGTPIVHRTGGFSGSGRPLCTPMFQGIGVVAYMEAGTLTSNVAHWFAVISPVTSGTLNVIGAIFFQNVVFGIPYNAVTNLGMLSPSNGQQANDPIIGLAEYLVGGDANVSTLFVIPSFSDIANGTYRSGFGIGYGPAEVPLVQWTHLGRPSDDHFGNLLLDADTSSNIRAFALPNNVAETAIYFYFNKPYTQNCISAGGAAPWNLEVGTVIGPSFPNGSMAKILLGNINYADLAETAIISGNLGPTPHYTIDNANWVDVNGNQVIPFNDEETFLSDGTPGGTDAYSKQPFGIPGGGNRLAPNLTIIMGMAGNQDFAHNALGRMFVRLRIFVLNVSSSVLVQNSEITCIAFVFSQIPGMLSTTAALLNMFASYEGADIVLRGVISQALSTWIFKSEFSTTPVAALQAVGVNTGFARPTFTQQGPGISQQIDADPGSINAPIIFEPPSQFTQGQTQVWIIATGENAAWGGCQVWLSLDGTTYGQIGIILRGGVQGVSTADFPAGSDPDTTHTLSLDVTESQQQLLSFTRGDADHGVSVAILGGCELIAYTTATLTSPFHYDLTTYIRRGQFGTSSEDHPSGTSFGFITNTTLSETFNQTFIGTTIFLKFPSFNSVGANVQELTGLTVYEYTITGAGFDFIGDPIINALLLGQAVDLQTMTDPNIIDLNFGNAGPGCSPIPFTIDLEAL